MSIKIIFAIMFSFILIFSNVTAFAVSDKQKNLYDKGILYYDLDGCNNSSEVAYIDQENSTVSSIYMLGDSITNGVKDTLEKKLVDKGISKDKITINGDNSRSIDSAGYDGGQSGMEGLETDKTKIENSDMVVVALGTNGGTDKDSIKKVVKKIRSYNDNAKIYWVNIGYTKSGSYDSNIVPTNNALKKMSTSENYKVIDWFSKINRNDPNNLIADGVHPNSKGYQEYANLIVSEIPDKNNNVSGSVVSTKNASNEKKTWLFLTSSDGMSLEPAQAAGVMGNLNQESPGFNPSTIEASGGGGFGLAQWTDDRRTRIENAAKKQGVNVNNFEFQLEYLKKEVESSYAPMLKKLKTTNDPKIATYIFHGPTSESTGTIPKYPFAGFEGSADGAGGIAERVADAKRFLKKYSGLSGSTETKNTNTCKCVENTNSSTKSVSSDASKTPSEADFIKEFGDKKSVAWAELGKEPKVYGKAESMKAWSTSKVLVVAAYLKEKGSAGSQEENITKALKESDNDAIAAVYSAGGGPSKMDDTMNGILRSVGDKKTKVSKNIGNGVTTYGQTEWSLTNQVKFMSSLGKKELVDKKTSEYILKKMSAPTQKWGLGTIEAIAYKPGWGDDPVTRQMGIVKSSSGKEYAVAIAQETGKVPDENGNTELAKWLQENILGGEDSSSDSGGCGDESINTGDLESTLKEFVWEDGRETGQAKPMYAKATAQAKKKGEYIGGCNGEDCGAFVTRTMRFSSYDTSYNSGEMYTGRSPDEKNSQWWYLDKNWEKIGVDVPTTKLQLGDVAIHGTHTYMFTGKIEGFKGDSAGASLCSKMPRAHTKYDDGFTWYRKK